MPRYRYVGRFAAVECAGQVVARGETAEFSADVATGLDGQETWELVPEAKTKTKNDEES